MLNPGDSVPHFEATTADGRQVCYRDLWQRRNLVLIALPDAPDRAQRGYLSALESRLSTLQPDDTALVVLGDAPGALPLSTLTIADRWGEVVHTEPLGADAAAWPGPDEIVEWVEFVRRRCPECPP